MFRCEECGSLSKPNETQNKKVTKTRNKTYYKAKKREDSYESYEVLTKKDENGHGWEIVNEIAVCKICSEK